MRLDDVGEVVDGDEDAGDPEPDQVQDDALEDRAPGDAQHRLGHRVGQRAQPRALATGHDHGPVGPRCRLEERVEEVQGYRSTGVVEDGDRVDPPGPHQVQRVDPGRAGLERDEVVVEGDLQRALERGAVEQRAADVAVGGQTGETAVGLDRERDPAGAQVERAHGVGDRAGTGDEGSLQRFSHRSTPAPGRARP